jgi:hypothetical protein
MAEDQSASENRPSAIDPRWDIGVLIVVVAVAFGLFASIAQREFDRPVRVAASPLATVTPTGTPVGGWWDHVTLTPPPLPPLPKLPAVGLGGAAGGAQAGQPVAFQVIDCPTGGAVISAITTAKVGWWNITGTAEIPNLAYWKGEISADGQGWTMLYRSPQPVRAGLLIEFNTRTVPPGTYQIRLLAVDRTGNYPAPCVIQVTTR